VSGQQRPHRHTGTNIGTHTLVGTSDSPKTSACGACVCTGADSTGADGTGVGAAGEQQQ
jgi:hypothetical protein